MDIWQDEVGRTIVIETDEWVHDDCSDSVVIGKTGRLRCVRHRPHEDLRQDAPQLYTCPREDCASIGRKYLTMTAEPF